jgi:antitoxin Phd
MINEQKNVISIEDANIAFTEIAKLTEVTGKTIIMENNHPKFVVVDVSENSFIDLTDDEKIDVVAKRVLERYRHAFEELAK